MNGYQFMSEHPFLTFFLAAMALAGLEVIVKFLIIAIRSTNIRKHGFPPEHCDADGDFHKPSEGDK